MTFGMSSGEMYTPCIVEQNTLYPLNYTHEQIEDVIRSMGHPMKVAEAYMDTPRFLILFLDRAIEEK